MPLNQKETRFDLYYAQSFPLDLQVLQGRLVHLHEQNCKILGYLCLYYCYYSTAYYCHVFHCFSSRLPPETLGTSP